MMLDEAKRRVLDAAHDAAHDARALDGGNDIQRAEARTLRFDAEAMRTLLAALGEPTAEQREAAAWHREAEEANQEAADAYGDSVMGNKYAEIAEMHRLAAEALERAPVDADAIRRAAIEEAAWVASLQTTDGSDFDVALHIAREIRALATGATPPTLATVRARVQNLERTEVEVTATGRREDFVPLADVLAAFDGADCGPRVQCHDCEGFGGFSIYGKPSGTIVRPCETCGGAGWLATVEALARVLLRTMNDGVESSDE
jgi:hypothetical protein